MFLTSKLAVSVNYIVFGALIYNGERKKYNIPKGGSLHFVDSMSTKMKFILFHNFPTIIITNQKQSKLICKF